MSTVRTAVIGRLAVSATCALFAGRLALSGLDGWGWFLFVALWLGCFAVRENEAES